MKQIIIIIIFLTNLSVFAQNIALTRKDYVKDSLFLRSSIQDLQTENAVIKKELFLLKSKLQISNDSINVLRNKIEINSNAISRAANQLGSQITKTEKTTTNRIDEVDQSLSNNSFYGIIGLLIVVITSSLIYFLLSERQNSDKSDIFEQLSKTKSSIEESLVQLFAKQTEIMETQLLLIEKQKSNVPTANQGLDHSLALKVASEINIIERNLSLMDSSIKGYKQLRKSIDKLKDNLNANGYEILDLLGKKYHPGLPVSIINSFPDETIEKDQEIISKILIPAVRFNDKIIQTAHVEVNVGV
jgi:hypothetical protein